MIKTIERTIKLYSAEKDGLVKELTFDFENLTNINKKRVKGCKIIENIFNITETINVLTMKEITQEITRRTLRKNYDY